MTESPASRAIDAKRAVDALRLTTSVDLFAGCGGLSLGLHNAGWDGLFAIERDPMAFETLQANLTSDSAPYAAYRKWPVWLDQSPHGVEDLLVPPLRDHLESLAGRVTLLAGGPPCQGFSVGGIRDGADKRNDLIHKVLEVNQVLKPPLVLIENVEGIARRFVSKPGGSRASVADEVASELTDMGYAVAVETVDASQFGVPQMRRRVLILAISRSLPGVSDISGWLPSALSFVRAKHLAQLGLPSDRAVTACEAIDDLDGSRRIVCPDSPKFEAGTYKAARSQYSNLMRRGVAKGTQPDSHRFTKHGPAILALYEHAQATQPPGRLSKQFLTEWGTKKDKKVLLDPSAPASTITTHPDEFIHYREPRNVTVREMARLQSFPDDFHFRGRYTINGPRRRFDVARCSQVGNAVPPLLAEAVGSALREICRWLLSEATSTTTQR